ncbi:Enhancer of polycomb protein [Salix suchowensis]|nr:Enhancer of polycomb protein [Salix suchowensis]
MVTLNAKLSGIDDEKLVSRVVEIWNFFWDQVLPYVEGTDALLSSLYRAPKAHRSSSPGRQPSKGSISTSSNVSMHSSSHIDVRSVALRSFRDRVARPCFSRTQAALRLCIIGSSSPTRCGESAVMDLLRLVRSPGSLADRLRSPNSRNLHGGIANPATFLSGAIPRDRRGRIAQKKKKGKAGTIMAGSGGEDDNLLDDGVETPRNGFGGFTSDPREQELLEALSIGGWGLGAGNEDSGKQAEEEEDEPLDWDKTQFDARVPTATTKRRQSATPAKPPPQHAPAPLHDMPRNLVPANSTRNRNRIGNKTRLKIYRGLIDADPLLLDEDNFGSNSIQTAGVDAEETNEHHLQAVLSAASKRNQLAAQRTRAGDKPVESIAYIRCRIPLALSTTTKSYTRLADGRTRLPTSLLLPPSKSAAGALCLMDLPTTWMNVTKNGLIRIMKKPEARVPVRRVQFLLLHLVLLAYRRVVRRLKAKSLSLLNPGHPRGSLRTCHGALREGHSRENRTSSPCQSAAYVRNKLLLTCLRYFSH